MKSYMVRLFAFMMFFVVVCGECVARTPRSMAERAVYTYAPPRIEIYSPDVEDTVRVMVVADTHLWISDQREEPFREYSRRMAAAYHTTTHYATGVETSPEKSLRAVADLAVRRGVDAVALLGDIVNYPSERAVELVCEVMDGAGVPWYYTCGNHDWHYEGMVGGRLELREEWRAKRLSPLFRGNNPNCYAVEIKGVRLLFVDSSTYDILPEQYEFMRREVRSGKPLVLMMHIPLYAPGRPVGYGIGHPDWNAAHDNGYKVERRERWPEGGHTELDYRFYDLVTTAPNLLCSFAGHVHTYGVDVIGGKPHYTVQMNARGGYYEVIIYPKKSCIKM